MERLTLAVLVAANLLFPLALYLAGLPKPWRAFRGESSPINWFSSVQCVLIGALAFGVWVVTVLGLRIGTEPVRRAWPWLVFCLGFLTMSLDEQFEGHELIREKILKPRGLFTDIDFMLEGDVVLISYVLGGLAMSCFLLVELRRRRASLVTFATAVALIGIAAVQDALDIELSRSVRNFQTIAEELMEIWAQLLFASSFVILLFLKLRLFLQGVGRRDGRTGDR